MVSASVLLAGQLGLFADDNYREGFVIGIIDGPITNEPTDYAIEPKPGLYIETSTPFKFANHSCNPNIELLGERVVVAKRSIEIGEELLFDYSNFVFDDWTMQCNCGSSNCRLIIGAR